VLTGVGAVVNTAKVEAGSAVAIFGLGGVGLSAVMGARAVGAYPIIAVDILPAKLELAMRAGATHTVDSSKDDAVGSAKTLATAYASTARGGKTIAIGSAHPSLYSHVSEWSFTR
jgi:alcohol dehydrogenase